MSGYAASAELIPHLLVVDDDARLRSLLKRYLSKQGWNVTCAKDAADARAKLRYFIYDLLVLDVMMPNETGLEFAKDFRTSHDTPILMLTAMGDTQDRIAGFEAGVDDYLPKPFEPRELALRISSILARTMKAPPATMITFGEFTLDKEARRLLRGDAPIHLTESEMALLLVFAEHLGDAVSRERLSEAIAKPEEDANPRSVDVLVTRLRKKIEDEPSRPLTLQTVRGAGYVLRR